MCGVTGFLRYSRDWTAEELTNVATRMGSSLMHRGPDDSGIFVQEGDGLALAHQRLSIVDLSPAGHQPMTTQDARFTIAYNGELYNALELRRELQERGVRFAGHSDTEIVLYAFSKWGTDSFSKLNGMFALAIWDNLEHHLTLARDPLGEKPMYYAWHQGTFLFGSELKALRHHPSFSPEIDVDAVEMFFHFGYVPAPKSVYKGVAKLPAGSWLQVSSRAPSARPLVSDYWALRDRVARAVGARHVTDLDELQFLIDDAVGRRMVADVPVGAFLSGGVDSSLIVARMVGRGQGAVKTFTMGFDVRNFDESSHAREVARHLGTEHHEMRMGAEDVQAAIPLMASVYDEPFADSSQLPTYLISQMAKQEVKVVLSGDGGDELFGGYDHYASWPRIWSRSRQVPKPIRRILARTIGARPPEYWSRVLAQVSRTGVLPTGIRGRAGERLAKVASVLAADSAAEAHEGLAAQWAPTAHLVRSAEGFCRSGGQLGGLPSFLDAIMFADLVTFLPDDILVKVDRASMSVGLETRVPLLDTRVVEAAWRIPPAERFENGHGKAPLRALVARSLPEHLTDRPKAGFVVPIAEWLQGPLREWADDLLSPSRLRSEGYLNVPEVQRCWTEMRAGVGEFDQQIWDVLMFESWLAEQNGQVSI